MANTTPVSRQLSIYDTFAESAAYKLLEALNSGRKPRDIFYPDSYYKDFGYYIFCASNKKKNLVFNVIDEGGNIPKDFVVNWRSLALVYHDILHSNKETQAQRKGNARNSYQ